MPKDERFVDYDGRPVVLRGEVWQDHICPLHPEVCRELGIEGYMTRTYKNKFGSPDDKNGRSNHIDGNADDSSGYIPRGKGGSNVGYIDGHVDWRAQNELGQKEYPSVGNNQPGRRQFYYTKSGNANRYYW